ncbi:WhiB family transcriptional regulator [Streptomyces sp. NPDC048290]|uniref:WhiB family transcriptional regulator n=1 Tax=Streptomyces sp. NPDC048290 TaxID=3155811 RepID=UPI0034413D0A
MDDHWRELAECRFHDPDLFFPVGTSGPAAFQTERAKAVCRTCPVREPCLRYALDEGEDSGVWGGASETERRTRRAATGRPARR